MNILILCGHSLRSYPYHKILDYKKNNLFVLMTSENIEYDKEFIEANKDKYKYIKVYDDFASSGEVEYDAIQLNKEYKIDSVVSISETQIERAAKLREYFGIKGQTYESASAFRDKIIMKKFVDKAGLRVPKHKKIDSAVDLISFVNENDYPVFLKPTSSAGSLDAMKIDCEETLKKCLKERFVNKVDQFAGYNKRYEVEEYIDEDFYSINGIVMDNEVVLVECVKYNTHADLEHISKHGYWSGEVLSRENPLYEKMVQYAKDLIASLPTPQNCVFHSEEFIDKEKNIILCEIACRPPGGGMIEALNNTFDIDFFKIAVLLQINPELVDKYYLIEKNRSYKKLYASAFVHPLKGTLTYINDKCPLDFVCSYEYFVKVGKTYNETGGDSCEGAAIFIVEADNESELRNNVQKSVDWFRANTKWE